MSDRSTSPQWIVLYDEDCGLCQWLLSLLLRWDRELRLRPLALQSPAAARLLADLTPEERMASWHAVAPTGERISAGAALAPLLRALPAGTGPAALAARFPSATERAYRWVAENRTTLSKLVPPPSKRRAADRVSKRERAIRPC